jgi:type VI secretion system protein ImpK
MKTESDELSAWVEPVLRTLVQLERERERRSDPDKLYQQCCQAIERFKTQAAQTPSLAADAEQACYALVALFDEIAMHYEGVLKDYWQPRLLQLRFFGENIAGEGFFDRLTALRGDAKRVPALRVFYLCLLFGFRGKYRLRGSELELLEIEESLKNELQRARAIPSELVLSPSGRRPFERFADARRNQLLVTLAAIAAGVSLLLYVGLRLSLFQQTQQLVEQLTGLLAV